MGTFTHMQPNQPRHGRGEIPLVQHGSLFVAGPCSVTLGRAHDLHAHVECQATTAFASAGTIRVFRTTDRTLRQGVITVVQEARRMSTPSGEDQTLVRPDRGRPQQTNLFGGLVGTVGAFGQAEVARCVDDVHNGGSHERP